MNRLKIFRVNISLWNLQGTGLATPYRPYILLHENENNLYLLQCYSIKENTKKNNNNFYFKEQINLVKTLDKPTYIVTNQILIADKKEFLEYYKAELLSKSLSYQIWNKVYSSFAFQKSFAFLKCTSDYKLIHNWVSEIYFKNFEKSNLINRKHFEEQINADGIRIDLTYQDVDKQLNYQLSEVSISLKDKKFYLNEQLKTWNLFVSKLNQTEKSLIKIPENYDKLDNQQKLLIKKDYQKYKLRFLNAEDLNHKQKIRISKNKKANKKDEKKKLIQK